VQIQAQIIMLLERKHIAGTGDWLLDLDAFKSWKETDGQVLWLNGISGSGKTILSSSVVEYLRQDRFQGNPFQQPARVAYFYFDFSDQAKQNAHGCIQSIVKQLLEQSGDIPEEVGSLYNESKDEKPRLERLTKVLISMLNNKLDSKRQRT
jgi:ABC-type glutathione transport system ATPase component